MFGHRAGARGRPGAHCRAGGWRGRAGGWRPQWGAGQGTHGCYGIWDTEAEEGVAGQGHGSAGAAGEGRGPGRRAARRGQQGGRRGLLQCSASGGSRVKAMGGAGVWGGAALRRAEACCAAVEAGGRRSAAAVLHGPGCGLLGSSAASAEPQLSLGRASAEPRQSLSRGGWLSPPWRRSRRRRRHWRRQRRRRQRRRAPRGCRPPPRAVLGWRALPAH